MKRFCLLRHSTLSCLMNPHAAPPPPAPFPSCAVHGGDVGEGAALNKCDGGAKVLAKYCYTSLRGRQDRGVRGRGEGRARGESAAGRPLALLRQHPSALITVQQFTDNDEKRPSPRDHYYFRTSTARTFNLPFKTPLLSFGRVLFVFLFLFQFCF